MTQEVHTITVENGICKKIQTAIHSQNRAEHKDLPETTWKETFEYLHIAIQKWHIEANKNPNQRYIDKLLDFIKQRRRVSYNEAYRFIHFAFAGYPDFTGIVVGLVNSGYIELSEENNVMWIIYIKQDEAIE